MKCSVLKLSFRQMIASDLQIGSNLSITARVKQQIATIDSVDVKSGGQVLIDQQLEMQINNSDIRRNTQCIVQFVIINGCSSEVYGKLEINVMDFGNYTKKTFSFQNDRSNIVTVHMTVNIASSSNFSRLDSLNSNNTSQKSQPKSIKKYYEQPLRQQPESISGSKIKPMIIINSAKKIPTQENIQESIIQFDQKDFINYPQNRSRRSQSQIRTISIPSISIGDQEQVNDELQINQEQNDDFFPKSNQKRVSQLFQQKEQINNYHLVSDQKKFNSIATVVSPEKLTVSHLNKPSDSSHFCTVIDSNLLKLTALRGSQSQHNISNKVLQNQKPNSSIFHTLCRMKSKFEKIYEQQALLNSQRTEKSIQSEQSQNKNSQIDINIRDSIISFRGVSEQKQKSSNPSIIPQQMEESYKPSKFKFKDNPFFKMEQNDSVNGEHSSEYSNKANAPSHKNTYRYKDPKHFKICRNVSMKINQTTPIESNKQYLDPHSSAKRYKLAASPKRRGLKKKQSFGFMFGGNGDSLTQTNLNFRVQQQSLMEFPYIKLNKDQKLQNNSDSLRKTNEYLIKANEQLQQQWKKAQQKLQISKNIIEEKQEMLNSQFESLVKQLQQLSTKLMESNAESKKRQSKIKHLLSVQQGQVREINNLKDSINNKNKIIKQLKMCLFSYEQQLQNRQKQEEFNKKIKIMRDKEHKEEQFLKDYQQNELMSTTLLPNSIMMKTRRESLSLMLKKESQTFSTSFKKKESSQQMLKRQCFTDRIHHHQGKYISSFNNSVQFSVPRSDRDLSPGLKNKRVLQNL